MSKTVNILKIAKRDEPGSAGLLLRVAVPLIITTSSQSIMQFVDRMFLSWYSTDTLAACLPAGLMSFAIISFFMGTCGYTSVFIANYYGQKRYASLSVALWQGVLVGAACWVIIAALTPVGDYIIGLSRHAPEVKVLERQYFNILTLFGGLAVINNALAGFFTGQGRTEVTMWVSLWGNIVNVALSYAMIFGKFGFPEMGIAGAAWSTVIGSFSITLIFLCMILSPRVRKKFRTHRLFGFHAPSARRLVKYGLPNGFGFFMDIFSFSVFAFFTGNIDKISLAASNIVLTLQSIIFMPLLGLAIAGQILMGQYVGRRQTDYGVKTTFTALKIGACYVILISIMFLSAPRFFTGMFAGGAFSADMALILDRTVPLMWMLCVFVWGDLTYLVFGDAIRGAGDTRFHMKAMACCALLLICGSWLIVGVLGGGIIAAWLWITFYAGATGAVMAWRFFSKRWQGIDITA
ncbi:MAG: MATE family efflux transporter [Elusimicrobiota bacterium]|jgi:MATE family multidrug resistance protein|nr:MATE family efflux transporter [Elusimicrobiota bacterium]